MSVIVSCVGLSSSEYLCSRSCDSELDGGVSGVSDIKEGDDNDDDDDGDDDDDDDDDDDAAACADCERLASGSAKL